MAVVNFIDFYSTLAEALTERTSPQIEFYAIRGIQLLPNNPYPYIQTTNNPSGVELEDWTAVMVNTWDGSETDVTAYFTVEDSFIDDNGVAQIDWSLTNVPLDYGGHLVYMRITQLVGETFYTNMFQLTDLNSEKTARFDYRDSSDDTMQSIQLKMWFWQPLKNQELSTYYETSTRNTVTTNVKSQKYEKWITEIMSDSLFLKISEVFEKKFKYLDLTRAYLFENIELKEHTGKENFARNTLKIAFNSGDTFDPLAVVASDPLIPEITLISIVANGTNAIYTFTYSNFTPSYFVYEYSQDEVIWTETTNGVVSPQGIAFNGTGVWYFRIEHPEAISNVIMLDFGDAVVAVDDDAQVEKGGVVDIPVLVNDTLVGTTTITAITAPTNGTAVAINGDTEIRYTHDDTSTTFDTFDYTIGNGLTSDSATVSVVVTLAGTSTSFNITTGRPNKNQACALALLNTKYHNGSASLPVVGDFIFNDAALTTAYDGNNGYHAIYGGRWIRINEFGQVTSSGLC